jgi:NAD(P)-dependent dehydrogenase (short-subunit alcohol dehydrogenase family)
MRHAAYVSMPYAQGSSGHPWRTKWSHLAKVMLSRRWRRACLWDGSGAPRRSRMRFCGSASDAASYVTGQSISVDGGFVMR